LGAASYQEAGTWTASVSHRWQYSDRHFVGDSEQRHRQLEDSQIINDVHLIDIGIGYQISKRFVATLSVPFQFASRRGNIENEDIENEFGNETVIGHYWTHAYGLSDIKLLFTGWIFDPETSPKGNVSFGLGVKFPTGEKDVEDVRIEDYDEATGELIADIRPVDNSIQPGDGAWGFITDLYGFIEPTEQFTLFASGTYIFEPETDANVSAGSGRVWSVTDSYLFRMGGGYEFLPKYGLTFTLNARLEGTPSQDVFGHDAGRRRPGYAVSIEPGLVFAKNGWFASFSAPIAVYRNREENFEGDEGDAAFADFITLLSVGRSF